MKFSTIAQACAYCLLANTAFSHASLEVKEAENNNNYKAVMRISHGCDGSATKSVTIHIPEGVINVKPMPKAGWALETTRGDYAKTYDYHGPRSEGVKSITWTGTLEDQHFEEFIFRGRITDDFKEGSTVYFPTEQKCQTGENMWIEIPEEGADSHSVERPAPALKIKQGHAHH
ncbi:hypothetical protein GCM10007939_05510 [Amylibacter marinus]|uniref:YncI copper-binding domain-containing protein n=1 Tax=Amylibacter marinus TaxID=1475483 RepID=A0ABQ5VS65_9RHOB|nr:DUF1775 domain-containing protein [Amylibacter marinus]GLQ34268.1 hypothetical protein GCM10007939_05510 [Amylibacter marinus]